MNVGDGADLFLKQSASRKCYATITFHYTTNYLPSCKAMPPFGQHQTDDGANVHVQLVQSHYTRRMVGNQTSYHIFGITVIPCVSKNAPTPASCSFDMHGQILIIFYQPASAYFQNDMQIQLSLSFHFCLLYWLLSKWQK